MFEKNLVQLSTHGTESDWRQITQLLVGNEIMFTEKPSDSLLPLFHFFPSFCLKHDCIALGAWFQIYLLVDCFTCLPYPAFPTTMATMKFKRLPVILSLSFE